MKSEFRHTLTLTLEGESHGPAVRAVLEGFPAGYALDEKLLMHQMRRRQGGQNAASTPRKEEDVPAFLSGLTGGVTDGNPIVCEIANNNVRSSDYAFGDTPRPSHADYTAPLRFDHPDMRGGGHFSARLTAPLCAIGAVCLSALREKGIYIGSHLARAGGVADTLYPQTGLTKESLLLPSCRPVPVMDTKAGERMMEVIAQAAREGDSVGGVVECGIIGLPAGLGTPLFDGVENRLTSALFALGGVRGVEFGDGFAAADMRGSVHNDPFAIGENGEVITETNHSAGIQAGITNGMPVLFRVAFKPTASIAREQTTVSLSRREQTTLTIRGRHDACIAFRALPCVESLAAVVVCDLLCEVGKM